MIKLIIFVLILSSFYACQTVKEEVSRPNVLFISIDDLNDWVGVLNAHPDVHTPNLDELASKGVLFSNAHCQAPLCGPSRASVMTGLLPSTTGIYQHIEDQQIKESSELASQVFFLPEYFGHQGYKTMGVGKLFHGGDQAHAFQEYGGEFSGDFGKFGPYPDTRFKYDPLWFGKPKGTVTDWGAYPENQQEMPDHNIAQWAIDQLAQKHSQPFFLGVGFIRPHVPWYAPQKWFDMFPLDSIEIPPYLVSDFDDIPDIGRVVAEVPMMPTTEWAIQEGEWKAAVQAYLACMAFTDYYVGEVLNALEKSEYAANTIVVLWSDHGYHLGEKNRFAKHSLWQRSTHVPLIFSGKDIAQGKVSDATVGLIDIYPTLNELCDLPVLRNLDGCSLNSLLENPTSEWPHAAITTYGENNHGVHLRQYNYIRYEDGSEELYDHDTDPNEWYNVAKLEKYQSIVSEMKTHLPSINKGQVEKSISKVNIYFRNKNVAESTKSLAQ